MDSDQRAAVANFEILRHRHPIGISDAFIAVLAARVTWVKQGQDRGTRRLKNLLRNAALLVIDMQVGFDEPAWGPRNNLDAEANVATLIAAWREATRLVIHVHHDSPDPAGLLRRGTPGNAPKREAQPRRGELIYRKAVNSSFIGTNLEADLHALGIETLVIVGLTTNHCISTTARMAGNLGFETMVVADATATFDRANLDGTMRHAEDVHQAALSDLRGEFAQIVTTKWLVAALASFAGEGTSSAAPREESSHV
jgi:nicotinamidase-related amidase